MATPLASISRTSRASMPPRVVVHGSHGVGKSTLGANAYKPIFLPLEDGLAGIETSAFPLLTSYAEVEAALHTLAAEPHEYGTAVVDSLDWLEPLIWAHVCKANNWPSIEAPGYGKGYIEANALWRQFFDKLDALRTRGMAIICIAHSQIKRFEAPETEAYERYEIKLQKGGAALTQEWADIIGFANFETAIKKEAAGFNNTRARGIATGRRLLHVVEKPAFVAKNRYGMPDYIPLDWNALVAAMTPPAPPAAAAAVPEPAPEPATDKAAA